MVVLTRASTKSQVLGAQILQHVRVLVIVNHRVRKTGAKSMLLNPAAKLLITALQITCAPIPPVWNPQAHVASTSVHGNRQAQPAWNRQAHVKVLVTAVVRVTLVVAELWNVGAHVILLRDASEEMTVLKVAFAQMGLTPIPLGGSSSTSTSNGTEQLHHKSNKPSSPGDKHSDTA
jgi:hypothetical protein